jgi:hypothetical protein
MGEALYEALNRYQPEEIEVWDVYVKYIVFDGSIFAAVYFRRVPPIIFPDIFVRDIFPGFIRIHHQVYTLEYTGRIDHY